VLRRISTHLALWHTSAQHALLWRHGLCHTSSFVGVHVGNRGGFLREIQLTLLLNLRMRLRTLVCPACIWLHPHAWLVLSCGPRAWLHSLAHGLRARLQALWALHLLGCRPPHEWLCSLEASLFAMACAQVQHQAQQHHHHQQPWAAPALDKCNVTRVLKGFGVCQHPVNVHTVLALLRVSGHSWRGGHVS